MEQMEENNQILLLKNMAVVGESRSGTDICIRRLSARHVMVRCLVERDKHQIMTKRRVNIWSKK